MFLNRRDGFYIASNAIPLHTLIRRRLGSNNRVSSTLKYFLDLNSHKVAYSGSKLKCSKIHINIDNSRQFLNARKPARRQNDHTQVICRRVRRIHKLSQFLFRLRIFCAKIVKEELDVCIRLRQDSGSQIHFLLNQNSLNMYL